MNLVERLRLQAEDLHILNPSSETVKCLSLGADRIEALEAKVAQTELALREARVALNREAQAQYEDGYEINPWISSALDKINEVLK